MSEGRQKISSLIVIRDPEMMTREDEEFPVHLKVRFGSLTLNGFAEKRVSVSTSLLVMVLECPDEA